MSQNMVQNDQIIKSFEKQLDAFINEFTEEELTNVTLNNFFDRVINNLKNERLIDNIIFEIYQGKPVVTKPLYNDYSQPLEQIRDENWHDENWQKFYGFNRNIIIENILTFISKNLKKASIKDKLYYSFAKLSDQLDLNEISDHFMNKISNYITFNDL